MAAIIFSDAVARDHEDSLTVATMDDSDDEEKGFAIDPTESVTSAEYNEINATTGVSVNRTQRDLKQERFNERNQRVLVIAGVLTIGFFFALMIVALAGLFQNADEKSVGGSEQQWP